MCGKRPLFPLCYQCEVNERTNERTKERTNERTNEFYLQVAPIQTAVATYATFHNDRKRIWDEALTRTPSVRAEVSV